MPVVNFEAQSKLFDVLYNQRDVPNIEHVNIEDGDRLYHCALDPQGFGRASSPKSLWSYVGKVTYFPFSKEIAVIDYYIASSGSICIDRPHP